MPLVLEVVVVVVDMVVDVVVSPTGGSNSSGGGTGPPGERGTGPPGRRGFVTGIHPPMRPQPATNGQSRGTSQTPQMSSEAQPHAAVGSELSAVTTSVAVKTAVLVSWPLVIGTI